LHKNLKYLVIWILLAGLLESNRVPIISILCTHIKVLKVNKEAEPVSETETINEASVKEYIHTSLIYTFALPVYKVSVAYPVKYAADFSYSFYPDVLTPPPNC